MHLRRLEPHQVSLHRELRLRALQEAPDSFGEALADVAARPSSYWEDLTRSGTVGGMWVDPAWRRRGVGRALLQHVFAWAREHGLSRLRLWAPAHSAAALSLYRGAGFRETGRRRPLPTNPVLQIVEMEAQCNRI